MAAAHDITEALIGDFRPDENFNKQDKIRLEKIAARQIFTTPDQAGMIALIDEYAEQKTPRAKTVRDFDMLDAMECALQYEGRYPEKMGIFEEFKAYTEPKLYSEAGKAYFEKLETNQAIIRQLAADILRDEPASRTRI